MLMLAYNQELGFQGQREVSGLFVLLGVSIKPLRLRRELNPDVSFSKEVMHSASYSIIRGGTFIMTFHCHLKERDTGDFLREQLQMKISPHYGFSTFFSPTFKYTAEVPELVSRFGLRSMEAAISRKLSSDAR